MQKPFKEVQSLVDSIEDTEIEELKKLQVDADAFKVVNPRHEQLNNLLGAIQRIQK